MPDLLHSLQSRDLGHLRIVASLWGVELTAAETDAALTELAAALLDSALVREILDALPAEACSALDALVTDGGRIPWATFARRFGQIREVGAGHRDREQVYLHPISAAEMLFYRALLARAFFDTPGGAQEFAYIPDDLLPLIHRQERGERGDKYKKESALSAVSAVSEEPLGRPATPKERTHVILADDRILDHACTLLVALRLGIQPPELSVPEIVLIELLAAAKLIGGRSINPEAVKSFLEMPRAEALASLVKAWQESGTFNELRQLPGLVCEGEWTNSSLITRHSLLNLLATIPHNQWWSLPAFIRAIKEKHPDFQRPAGDYDSWFIKRAADGVYLRGFVHWDDVDGALIRYLISGPLFWLGMTELASPSDSEVITAFRVVSNVERQTSDARRSTFNEMGKLHVSSQGKITIPRFLPRAARYQISRFCVWDEAKPDEYRYRVTTASLKKAGAQGLKISQLLSLLAKNAAAEIPPAFVKALKRWEKSGTEARVETQTILRVSRPEFLDELRKSKAGRFLGETLGPVTIVVKPGAQSKVLAALAELGLLAEEVHEE
ncbi:MAG: hypothetical protein KJ606_07900 [Chloroflexi bacterium]|nr:hypothetical protein [Chloroflexota bacterium]